MKIISRLLRCKRIREFRILEQFFDCKNSMYAPEHVHAINNYYRSRLF